MQIFLSIFYYYIHSHKKEKNYLKKESRKKKFFSFKMAKGDKGEVSVTKRSRGKPRSRSQRSGLQFPVGRLHRFLKKGNYAKRVGSGNFCYTLINRN